MTRVERGLELGDLDAALVRLDELASGFVPGLVPRHLDAAKLDGELRAQLILVGLDIGDGHRHGRLDPPRGEADGPLPQRRGEHQGEQARDQKAERRIHSHVDHRTSAPRLRAVRRRK